MKFIVLDCKRGGKERGAILSVGPKADITLEEAKVLISERMASEYDLPVVSEVDTGEVTRLTGELEVANSKVTALIDENGKLSGELEAANAKVTSLTEENAKLVLTAAPKSK